MPTLKGGRFPDGRPKVEDKLLERLRKISMEEAWVFKKQSDLMFLRKVF